MRKPHFGKLRHRIARLTAAGPIETAAIIGLVLFIASEIMPYLPIKSNGLVQGVLEALMTVFPKPEKK